MWFWPAVVAELVNALYSLASYLTQRSRVRTRALPFIFRAEKLNYKREWSSKNAMRMRKERILSDWVRSRMRKWSRSPLDRDHSRNLDFRYYDVIDVWRHSRTQNDLTLKLMDAQPAVECRRRSEWALVK